MFNVKVEINDTLFNAFKYAMEKAYKKNITKRKIAEIKVGSYVFHDGLVTITEKSNGKIKLSDGTEYDFLSATKEKLFTI